MRRVEILRRLRSAERLEKLLPRTLWKDLVVLLKTTDSPIEKTEDIRRVGVFEK